MRTLFATHTVIFEPPISRLDGLLPILRTPGVEIRRSDDPGVVEDLVANGKLTSMVIIDDAIGLAKATDLLIRLRKSNPNLPILWIAGDNPAPRGLPMPSMLLRYPFEPEELMADVHALLDGRMYTEVLAQQLVHDCQSILCESYGLELSIGEPVLKANKNALAETSAVLPFCGSGIAGRLVVCASRGVLKHLYQEILPGCDEPADSDVEDLAGELANLLTGRAKAYFATQSLNLELGLPVVLNNEQIREREWASRPTLVLPVAFSFGPLFIAFSFDVVDERRIEDVNPGLGLNAGKIMFL